jgi:glucose-1-phosphate thymidylyltransferase
MRAIVPAAGRGTRLYPQTHTKPKAMVRLAGRPILGHILNDLAATRIEGVVVVVGGPMKEQIIEYAEGEFGDRFSFAFPEQESPEGLGHSVLQAEPFVRGESAFVVLGDMLFESGYRDHLRAHAAAGDVDGSIGVKPVDEPRHYGVVDTDADGAVEFLVEKPADPPSDLAISGAYVVENTDALFDALDNLVRNGVRGAGDEFQLTDALQRMVEAGCSLGTFDVGDWYDCGRPETLLEANRVLLSRVETNGLPDGNGGRAAVVPPVDFGEDVTVEECVVGPNVSIDDGTTLRNSIVRESILGRNTTVSGINIAETMIGDNVTLTGEATQLNIGDNSSLEL